MSELCQGLKMNESIEQLTFSRNNIRAAGMPHLSDVLGMNKSLRKLKLTRNQIGTHKNNETVGGLCCEWENFSSRASRIFRSKDALLSNHFKNKKRLFMETQHFFSSMF